MIQTLLTIASFTAAVIYIGWFVYRNIFSKSNKCQGCAVSKIYEMKLNAGKAAVHSSSQKR